MPFDRSTPVPQVVTSQGTFIVTTDGLVDVLPHLPVAEQDAVLDALGDFIKEVEEHGDTTDYYDKINFPLNGADVLAMKGVLVDKLNWTMAKFLRVRTHPPTRQTRKLTRL